MRELSEADRAEYSTIHLAYFQMGFEPFIVAVYSDHGVTMSDAGEAAEEFYLKHYGEAKECDRVELSKP